MCADERVTLDDLKKVEDYSIIRAEWKELASTLEPDMFDVGAIDVIVQKYPNDPFMQTKSMLEQWRDSESMAATRRNLIKALVSCGWRREAEEIFEVALVKQVVGS